MAQEGKDYLGVFSKQQKATDTVLEQAKLLCKDWAEGNGKHEGSFDKYIEHRTQTLAIAEKKEYKK